MKRRLLSCLLMMLMLTACTTIQRGTLIGALIGSGVGAGVGAAGGGVGVAIGAGAGAGAGALLGMVAGDIYEVHRQSLEDEFAVYDKDSGAAIVRTKYLAEYEKRLVEMEARNRDLIAQNERLIAASYTLADAIGADGTFVRVETTPEGVMQVSMVSEILFESGSATLKEAIYPVLDEIGRTIGEDYPDYYVAIEGHTDDSEVSTTGYRSHWELSAARALAVLHYFSDQELVSADRMAVASYASYRPVAAGEDARSRRINRRVVITLMPNRTMPMSGF